MQNGHPTARGAVSSWDTGFQRTAYKLGRVLEGKGRVPAGANIQYQVILGQSIGAPEEEEITFRICF